MNLSEISKSKIILFVSIALLFATFSIYIINLAQGREFGSDGKFFNTSIIRINSKPSDVEVYINNEKATRTENRVEGIEPGEVTIKLVRNGYAPWEKTITLEPGVVKDISAQLYPENLNFTQFTTTNIDQMVYSSVNPEFVYYTVTDTDLSGESGIWRVKLVRSLLDFGAIVPEKIADFNSSFIELLSSGYEIEVSDDNNRLLVKLPEKQNVFVYDVNTKNFRTNLVSILGYYPDIVSWLSGSSTLLIQKDGLIFEYDLNSFQSSIINFSAAGTPIFTRSAGTIYYQRSDNKTLYAYVNRASTPLLLPDNFNLDGEIKQIFSPRTNPSFLFISTETSTYLLDVENQYFARLFASSKILALSHTGLHTIYQIGDELFSLSLEENLNDTIYTVINQKISLKPNSFSKIYYTQNNNLVTHVKATDAASDVIFMDADGLNPVTIMSNQNLVGGTGVLTTNDSKELLFLLFDQSEEDTTVQLKNIYKLALLAN